tara:strand:- start:468 stop:1481 length:1014 start_codon:yes stop_codon:yes gene_type:complete
MPARSNPFQRLVRAIQGHLSRAGTVTESRFLADRDTGSPVEVDIVIQDVVGGHEVLIGIECTARRRPATIEWYREMRGKHRDLPITKTVLVSKSGFTPEVREKAKLDNITLLSLQEAHSFEWQGLLAKVQGGKIANVSFSLREMSVAWPAEAAGLPDGLSPADLVVHASGREITLPQFALIAAQGIGFTKGIMANLGAVLKQTDHASFSFRLPAGALTTPEGGPLDALEVTATLSIHPQFKSVNWQPVDFNGQTVATAAIPANFIFPEAVDDTVVTLSQDASDEMRMSLLGPSDNDIQLDVFPSALWQQAAVVRAIEDAAEVAAGHQAPPPDSSTDL